MSQKYISWYNLVWQPKARSVTLHLSNLTRFLGGVVPSDNTLDAMTDKIVEARISLQEMIKELDKLEQRVVL